MTLAALLNRVIAYGMRRAECFFQVARLKNVFHPLRVMRPHACKEISLKLNADGHLVVFGFAHAALL